MHGAVEPDFWAPRLGTGGFASHPRGQRGCTSASADNALPLAFSYRLLSARLSLRPRRKRPGSFQTRGRDIFPLFSLPGTVCWRLRRCPLSPAAPAAPGSISSPPPPPLQRGWLHCRGGGLCNVDLGRGKKRKRNPRSSVLGAGMPSRKRVSSAGAAQQLPLAGRPPPEPAGGGCTPAVPGAIW